MDFYKNKTLTDLESEIWKDITGFEGLYKISSLGRVKSLEKKTGRGTQRILEERIMGQRIGVKSNGAYCLITLCSNGNQKTCKGHRLVAQAFIPNPLNLPQVNHKDGIKTHNYPDNLEWCTSSENNFHAFRTGLRVPNKDNPKISGSQNMHSKIKESDVVAIRRLHADGVSNIAISKLFPVNSRSISAIVNYKTWKHVKL